MKKVLFLIFICLFLGLGVEAQGDVIDFGVDAYQHLEKLDKIGGRLAGTVKESEAADYIVNYILNYSISS